MTHGHPHGVDRRRSARSLATVLALTAAYAVFELVGGLLTGSLALLADAGHMAGDVFALALALFAGWLAARPATLQRSFGYHRAEILAALANGIALVAIALWIFLEAVQRLTDPPDILAGWVLVVALAGLAVNLAGALILAGERVRSLNVRAAFLHVLADLAATVGVITAALVVLATGWRQADAVVGIAIGLLILASSWTILRDSLSILLESAPAGIDAGEVGRRMAAADGVVEVHDLHIWTITSGFPALSAHVLVRAGDDCHARRRELEELLEDERRGLQIAPLRRQKR
jgi:cobalt-zinc-cadmium efflux system protein